MVHVDPMVEGRPCGYPRLGCPRSLGLTSLCYCTKVSPEAEKGKARPQTISLLSPPCNLL